MKLTDFYFYNLLFFVFFLIISRFLFPFSDEPDITVKSAFFLDFLNNYFNSYLDSNLFTTYNISNNCGVQSNPLSMWALINQKFCEASFRFLATNIIITIIFSAPIFFLIYILSLEENKKILQNLSSNNLLNSVLLSFLYGSFIYFLGLFSPEKITLLLSISIFLFINNFFIILILLTLIFILDLGSFLFVFSFYFFYVSFIFLNKFIYLKNILISIFLLLFILFLLKSFAYSYLLNINLLGNKYSYFIEGLLGIDKQNPFTIALEKYPLIFRIIHSAMSFIYISALNIKVPLVYILNFIAIYMIVNKWIRNKEIIHLNNENIKSYFMMISAIIVIILFFILFPLNTNGKNLIFLLPIFVNFAMIFYDKYRIFYFMLLNNFVLFYFLTLYRI